MKNKTVLGCPIWFRGPNNNGNGCVYVDIQKLVGHSIYEIAKELCSAIDDLLISDISFYCIMNMSRVFLQDNFRITKLYISFAKDLPIFEYAPNEYDPDKVDSYFVGAGNLNHHLYEAYCEHFKGVEVLPTECRLRGVGIQNGAIYFTDYEFSEWCTNPEMWSEQAHLGLFGKVGIVSSPTGWASYEMEPTEDSWQYILNAYYPRGE